MIRPSFTAMFFASGYFGSSVVIRPLMRIKSAGVDVFMNCAGLEVMRDLPQRGYGAKPRVGAKRLPWEHGSIDYSTPTGLWHIGVNQMTQPRWGWKPPQR